MSSRIEQLADRLTEATGIAFAKDAWENKAPDDYGVVSLSGESEAIWADDGLSEQVYGLTITLYVHDGGEQWLERIQEVLGEFDLVFRLPSRSFLYDVGLVEWRWTAQMYGALEGDDDGTDDH